MVIEQSSFVKRWILGAAIVLAMDMFRGSTRRDSRAHLLMAKDIFGQKQHLDSTPTLTAGCLAAVEALLEVVDGQDRSQNTLSVEGYLQDAAVRLQGGLWHLMWTDWSYS